VPAGFHPPVEEYLKVTYELEEEGIPVIRARLAERLGHSGPTVTETVRRLVESGHLEVHDRALRLTKQGRDRAEAVVRRHRLAERLLADVIGLDWAKVHQEAGRWEHVISQEVEERLVVLLDDPATCPHGNPIPGSNRPRRHLRLLSGARPGEEVRLERITETVEVDLDTLEYLDAHGFRPGTRADVKERAPDGTLTLAVGETTLAVSPALAAQLYVEDLAAVP
jgi:DtxR family transcriptional regulator, Mn-dependent transcriptional regulator